MNNKYNPDYLRHEPSPLDLIRSQLVQKDPRYKDIQLSKKVLKGIIHNKEPQQNNLPRPCSVRYQNLLIEDKPTFSLSPINSEEICSRPTNRSFALSLFGNLREEKKIKVTSKEIEGPAPTRKHLRHEKRRSIRSNSDQSLGSLCTIKRKRLGSFKDKKERFIGFVLESDKEPQGLQTYSQSDSSKTNRSLNHYGLQAQKHAGTTGTSRALDGIPVYYDGEEVFLYPSLKDLPWLESMGALEFTAH